MPSHSRIYTAIVVVCALGLIMAAAVFRAPLPPVADTGHVPPQVPAEAAVPVIDASAQRLLDAEKARVESAVRAATFRKRPFLDRHQSALTVVLPGPRRYTLADLPRRAVVRRPGHVLLRLPVVVTSGARLLITQRRLLLRSTAKRQASVVAVGAGLVVRGTRIRTVGPDTDLEDGRAYLQVQGGRMVLRDVHASYLGFATGRTSGVAWMHRFGVPATGAAVDSTFAHNLFGVYSSGADGLRFVRDRFVRNDVYGFDPHGAPPGMGNAKTLGSNNFVVRDSVAAFNGRHGFIFSSGCNDNQVIDSTAHNNGGSGFVIDDGKPRAGLLNPSNDNLLRGIEARDNAGVGVVIEGGRDNRVTGARLVNNGFGLRITDATRDTVVTDTEIEATEWTALAVSDRARAQIIGVRIDGATVGVDSDGGARLQDVTVNDAVVTGLRLRPTDVVSEVTVTGAGRRTIDGIQPVRVVGWRSDQTSADALTPVLSSLRHQVWLLLLITPILLLSLTRVVQRARNLIARSP